MDVRQALRKAWPDIVAGGIFVAFGLVFAIQSLGYELGTLLRMGAGYFPLLLSVVLIVLGAIIIAGGFTAEGEEAEHAFPWRGMVMLPLAFIVFGLTVRGLGVGPAVFIATSLAGFASTRVRPLTALAIAAGLTVTTVLIFVVALQLRLPIVGPWLMPL